MTQDSNEEDIAEGRVNYQAVPVNVQYALFDETSSQDFKSVDLSDSEPDSEEFPNENSEIDCLGCSESFKSSSDLSLNL